MNFLSSPNLPETIVNTVAVGNGYSDVITELENLGIDVIELNLNKKLGLLANHADMLVFDGGNGNFVIDVEQDILCEKINKWGGTVNNISFEDGAAYPKDVLLNAAVVGEYLICNKKTISRDILDFTDYKIIDVNQGYSKCSTCIVNSQAIITDDMSVYNAAKTLIDVLLISKGDIALQGFNYGFIGGATFKLDKNNLAIIGNINTHSDSDLIKSFLKNHSVSIINLSNKQITDIGGVVPILA